MRRLTPLLLLPWLLISGGCFVAVAAGAAYGLVKFDKNEAVTILEAPAARVWRASIDALESRGYELRPTVSRDLPESLDKAVVSGEGYWLRIEERPGQRTELRVRIGTFQTKEHKRKSALLIESIEARL